MNAQTALPNSRRGFLRALAALPLLGGGVQLLGNPTAAAVPVSQALLNRYLTFLAKERIAARVELDLFGHADFYAREGYFLADAKTWTRCAWWMETANDPEIEGVVTRTPASTRAAVVLSAAGVRV